MPKLKLQSNTVMFVASSGGHLTQLLKIAEKSCNHRKVLITEETDVSVHLCNDSIFDSVLLLPHGGRENLFVFPFKFFVNWMLSAWRVLLIRPRVVVTTGAHTAVPTCYLAKVVGAKVIYVETFARITSPSLTGRMVHPIADCFYVQSPKMLKFYRKAQYHGSVY